MKLVRNNLTLLIGLICLAMALSYAQSLGDVAREQRQKQAAKKARTTPKVLTNEDLPEHPDAGETTSSTQQNDEAPIPVEKKPAEQWRQEIEAQKKSVANLQAEIEQTNSSIHFASGNCVRNCVQYNEQQVQKQDSVQQMQAQLDKQKKKLEDMQEAARKQGYGGSVYEP
jgi:hypothetical protein